MDPTEESPTGSLEGAFKGDSYKPPIVDFDEPIFDESAVTHEKPEYDIDKLLVSDSDDLPDERPIELKVERPGERPVEQPGERPFELTFERPGERPGERPPEQSIEQQAESEQRDKKEIIRRWLINREVKSFNAFLPTLILFILGMMLINLGSILKNEYDWGWALIPMGVVLCLVIFENLAIFILAWQNLNSLPTRQNLPQNPSLGQNSLLETCWFLRCCNDNFLKARFEQLKYEYPPYI